MSANLHFYSTGLLRVGKHFSSPFSSRMVQPTVAISGFSEPLKSGEGSGPLDPARGRGEGGCEFSVRLTREQRPGGRYE